MGLSVHLFSNKYLCNDLRSLSWTNEIWPLVNYTPVSHASSLSKLTTILDQGPFKNKTVTNYMKLMSKSNLRPYNLCHNSKDFIMLIIYINTVNKATIKDILFIIKSYSIYIIKCQKYYSL